MRLQLFSMEGSGDKDDLFKVFFIHESVSNLNSNQKKEQFKSFFNDSRQALPTIKEESEVVPTKVKLKQVTLNTKKHDDPVRQSTDMGEIPRSRTPQTTILKIKGADASRNSNIGGNKSVGNL